LSHCRESVCLVLGWKLGQAFVHSGSDPSLQRGPVWAKGLSSSWQQRYCLSVGRSGQGSHVGIFSPLATSSVPVTAPQPTPEPEPSPREGAEPESRTSGVSTRSSPRPQYNKRMRGRCLIHVYLEKERTTQYRSILVSLRAGESPGSPQWGRPSPQQTLWTRPVFLNWSFWKVRKESRK